MKLRQTIQNILFIASIGIVSLYADDGAEFNILPRSPLDADFFDNDIPASYLSSRDDKTALNYAIIESGPTAELQDNEIYIEHLPVAYESTSNYNANLHAKEINTDLHSAAGTFIDDTGEVLIPENLVSIESYNNSNRSPAIAVTSSTNTSAELQSTEAGEFVSDETDGVTAISDMKDKYHAFPAGTFTLGYQMMYMNYTEDGGTSESIYNGIKADYRYNTDSNLVLGVSSSLLGGAIFNKDNLSIYSDTTVTFGRKFSTADKKASITSYLGFGLRYMNNVFADSNAIERNTLQLYIPVGLRADYTPSDKLRIFGDFEAAAIALNNNWTTYSTSHDNSSSGFNGFSTKLNLGIEYRITNTATFGISPYYQYIYTDKNSSSSDTNTNTHMVGLNAYIKF